MDRQTRRTALKGLGIAAGTVILGSGASLEARAATQASLVPSSASSLAQLTHRLEAAPRRRDFKSVPMILEHPEQWDYEALTLVLGYRGGERQVWDNTEINGAWLNLMRNSLNAQVFSFKHPEFLAVSATHGSAHLALFDQAMWDKYGLAKMAGGKLTSNSLIDEKTGAAQTDTNHESAEGAYSSHDNSIPALQKRGVVFLSCHNAIWELAEKLIGANTNPDKLSIDALAAELTNHVIPSAIVTPGAVGTLPELQKVGFHYAK
ncbi:hypothetical protein BurMR1_1848 [Burkholderia sp. MR1]|nr:hypothetical protein BurMR1_1848 [Burkholderia sp. MR1]